MMDDDARLHRATALLGYTFKDRKLLLRALTHSSFENENKSSGAAGDNEVLELLGDAVLSLCTMTTLLQATPSADEGELTDRRAAYVSEDALAVKADEAGLTELLRTGKSIEGKVPLSARADVVEALLGAVYQDGGLDVACAVMRRVLGDPPLVGSASAYNAKRVLQERLQRLFGAPPSYDIERLEGPNHAPSFRAHARFQGAVLGSGDGGSKRTATEAAAADAVTKLNADDDVALRERFGRAPS